jgi:hypothetical protein
MQKLIHKCGNNIRKKKKDDKYLTRLCSVGLKKKIKRKYNFCVICAEEFLCS